MNWGCTVRAGHCLPSGRSAFLFVR